MAGETLHWLGGAWRTFPGAPIELRSPIDGESLTHYVEAPASAAAETAAAAAAASDPLWAYSPAERCAALRDLADRLEADTSALAAAITRENGCPARQAPALQVGSAVALLRAMADIGENFAFGDERPGARGGRVRVDKLPAGPALGIVPWNVPLFLACAKLAPALIAGCPIVLKPSPENALSMARFARHLAALALPPGAVNLLLGGRELGAALVEEPAIAKVSFTGSTAAGRRVGEACAKRLARCTLELGGKSAALFLDDAELDTVHEQLLLAMLQNNGQVCGAQSRLLLPRARYRAFRDELGTLFDALRVGDPRHPETDIGPVISAPQARRIEGMVERARAAGARAVSGGDRRSPGPAWVTPLLAEGLEPAAELCREEVFGPVVVILPYDSEDEAVALANDSPYGLSGSVWSADVERAAGEAARLRTGSVGINSKKILDFAAPFGGFRDSGVGREMGPEGVDGYLEARATLLP